MWQFTIWWRWSAMLASNCNNMILTNKKGCSLQCFLLRKSLHLYGHVRRCQENAWKGKQLDNKTARLRQLCCWVAILSAAAEIKRLFQLSNNRYDFIRFNASQLFRFGVWLLSRKHSFQWNFGITAGAANASETDVLKVSCCLHGLLHLPGKPSMYCDCMD